MHRIDTSTAQKDKFGQGKNGFTDGDPSTGRQSTDLNADMFDALQEEVCAVIEAANITLKKGELNQLLTALKVLFLAEDDSRVSGALQKDKNLSDLTDSAKAREALALDKVGNWVAVQQGGGTGMKDNKVYLGWSGTKLIAQVDSTQMGALFYEKNPPTAAQTGAYPLSGGEVEGEVWSAVDNNYRLVAGNRGAFWRFDSSNMYLMFTNDGDPHGGFNDLRPLIADFATGKLSTGHDFSAGGNVYSGGGASRLATDGNIYGSVWGGFLNNWIAGQIAAQVGAVQTWVSQNYVSSVKLGAMGWLASIADGPGNGYTGGGGTMQTTPAGCVVIGGTNNKTSNLAGLGFFYRPLMIAVNGQWVTIGQD
ncbi:hypothetical protein F3I20_21885 [Candidatus Pantoea gossypiicola]|uniref:Long-tail fiber proximal subunit trimerization domain-containing protein n=2 Tax=Candidatus Pantoea gossypiicola TaxID=2608008 RepID=A0AB34CEE4_9GAMM|nr:hypothetical protein [Pantoea gossypiicola]KAA6118660.1 hypothetical protein F3I20_21885 [Pantoea gossypiicola]